MFQSLLTQQCCNTKCYLKISVPLYTALLFHLSHHDQDMELNDKPCSSWVWLTTGHPHKGPKFGLDWGAGIRNLLSISFKEIWQLQQTGTFPLPLIQAMVSHCSGTPAACSPHPSSLCQAQSVPLCWPLEKLVGVMKQRFACPAGEARSACFWIETTTDFFFKPNYLFE